MCLSHLIDEAGNLLVKVMSIQKFWINYQCPIMCCPAFYSSVRYRYVFHWKNWSNEGWNQAPSLHNLNKDEVSAIEPYTYVIYVVNVHMYSVNMKCLEWSELDKTENFVSCVATLLQTDIFLSFLSMVKNRSSYIHSVNVIKIFGVLRWLIFAHPFCLVN